jgi:hypothetical protein
MFDCLSVALLTRAESIMALTPNGQVSRISRSSIAGDLSYARKSPRSASCSIVTELSFAEITTSMIIGSNLHWHPLIPPHTKSADLLPRSRTVRRPSLSNRGLTCLDEQAIAFAAAFAARTSCAQASAVTRLAGCGQSFIHTANWPFQPMVTGMRGLWDSSLRLGP